MKTKISSFLLATTLFLSGFAGVSMVSAKQITPKTLQTAAPYFSRLLQLEPTPPAGSQTLEEYGQNHDDSKSIAFPVSVGMMEAMLNFLSRHQDYFNLYTANVRNFIDDTTVSNTDGSSHHHYVCHPGQRNKILGYLSCFDIQTADTLADSVANPNNSYEIYNNVGVYQNWNLPSTKVNHKLLQLNLGYDYLSSNIVAALDGEHTDSHGNSISVGYKGSANAVNKDGTPKTTGLALNAYYFNLTLAFHDKATSDEHGQNYGDVFDQQDPDQNYTNNQ